MLQQQWQSAICTDIYVLQGFFFLAVHLSLRLREDSTESSTGWEAWAEVDCGIVVNLKAYSTAYPISSPNPAVYPTVRDAPGFQIGLSQKPLLSYLT